MRNQLTNFPVTRADILAAEDIFGPDLGTLKGKTTRSRPVQVRDVVNPIPPTILERYQSVTLCADLMHVNGIPFLVTISRHLKFGTVEAQPNHLDKTITDGLLSAIKIYRQCRFKVSALLVDGEFDTDTIREAVAGEGTSLNSTG
jgi:hypothetical protein